MSGDYRLDETIAQNIREDSDLEPQEKETSVNFPKRADDARLFTAEAGLMRRVVWHPEIRVTGLIVKDGDTRGSVAPEDYDRDGGKDIVGVRADVPVSLFTISSTPRNDTQHARIISHRVRPEQGAD